MTLRDQAFQGLPLNCFIIDAHTHLDEYYAYGWYQPPSITSPEDTLKLVASLGIDCIVTAPHALIYGSMELANSSASKSAEKFPDKVYGYISVCPQEGLEEIKKQCLKYGDNPSFLGFKMLGGYHGSYLQKEYEYVFDYANERKCPVLCHTWDNNPSYEEFNWILEKYRDLSLLIAHLGGGNKIITTKFSQLINTYPNAYFEMCGAINHELSDEDIMELVGPYKMIFGTDLINMDPRYDFGRLAFSTIQDEMKKIIFSGNYLRLLDKSSMGKIRVPEKYLTDFQNK